MFETQANLLKPHKNLEDSRGILTHFYFDFKESFRILTKSLSRKSKNIVFNKHSKQST